MTKPDQPKPTRGGLTLERYAEVLATVRHFASDGPERVLDVLAIDRDEWTEATTRWPQAIDLDIASDTNELVTTFADAFNHRREELSEQAAPLSALVPVGASRTEGGAPLGSPASPRPSSQLPSASPIAPMRASAKPSPWASPDVLPQRGPARGGVAIPERAASGDPAPAEPAQPAAGTVDETAIGAAAVVEEPLPFRGMAPAPPSALDALEPAKANDLDGTSALGQLLPLDEVLPFPGAGPSTPAGSDQVPPGPPSTPAGPAAGTRPPTGKAKQPPTAAHLTLEQYASMCAELAVYPERELAIARRYGMADPANRAAVQRHYEERWSRQPELRKQWEAKVSRYTQWLRKRREPADEPEQEP